jgi:hypothetical protein
VKHEPELEELARVEQESDLDNVDVAQVSVEAAYITFTQQETNTHAVL